VKPLEYENLTQAAAGNVTTIAIYIGCVVLVLSFGKASAVKQSRLTSILDAIRRYYVNKSEIIASQDRSPGVGYVGQARRTVQS
jgi:hypothetical protein